MTNIDATAQARIDAFRLASLQGPVLAGSPDIQQPGAPTFSFFYSQLKPADRLRVIKEIKTGVATDWQTKHDAAIEAMGLVKPPPAVRLQVYEGAFDEAHWRELQLKFPQRYDELWRDFTNLQARQAAGNLEV